MEKYLFKNIYHLPIDELIIWQVPLLKVSSESIEKIREIELAQKRMEYEKGSIEDFVIADAQFHQSIIRAADNEILESMEGVIFSALLNSIRITNKDPRDNTASIPFHSAVTNAIVERNPDLAELNMKKLLGDAEKRLRKESKEDQIALN